MSKAKHSRSFNTMPGQKIRLVREVLFKESRPNFAKRCGFSEYNLKNLELGYRVAEEGPSILLIATVIEEAVQLGYGIYSKEDVRIKLLQMMCSLDESEGACTATLEFLRSKHPG